MAAPTRVIAVEVVKSGQTLVIAGALGYVGRVAREREESRVPPAVLACSLGRMETRVTGQGQEADLQGSLRGQLWT